jgi:hypothetical protein
MQRARCREKRWCSWCIHAQRKQALLTSHTTNRYKMMSNSRTSCRCIYYGLNYCTHFLLQFTSTPSPTQLSSLPTTKSFRNTLLPLHVVKDFPNASSRPRSTFPNALLFQRPSTWDRMALLARARALASAQKGNVDLIQAPRLLRDDTTRFSVTKGCLNSILHVAFLVKRPVFLSHVSVSFPLRVGNFKRIARAQQWLLASGARFLPSRFLPAFRGLGDR